MNDPVMSDVLLTPAEMAAFNARLETRTGGRMRVGPEPISRGQARALWSAAKVFGGEPQPPTRLRSSRRRGHELYRASAVVALSAVALSGCATFGGNVKGDFACRAPDGICAPTSRIDDQALAMISGSDAELAPAGAIEPGDRSNPMMIPVSAVARLSRSTEKVLRIVFPAHVDRLGRFREAGAIHAVVERGAWMTAAEAGALPTLGLAALRTEQLANAELAPSLAELAASSPEVAFPQYVPEAGEASGAVAAVSQVAQTALSPALDLDLPIAAAVASARHKAHAARSRPALLRTPAARVRTNAQLDNTSRSEAGPAQVAAVQSAAGTPVVQPLPPARVANVRGSGPAAGAATGAMAPISSFDLTRVAGSSPMQVIRDQVGTIFASRAAPKASQAAAPSASAPLPERAANSPSVLTVSGVDK